MHHLGLSPPSLPPNTARVAVTKPAFWRGRLRPEGWGGVACLSHTSGERQCRDLDLVGLSPRPHLLQLLPAGLCPHGCRGQHG